MKLSLAVELAENIKHGLLKAHRFLEHWSIAVDNAKRRAGSCRPAQKLITISKHHVLNNDEAMVKDTILHELAHAIAYERYGAVDHGHVWRKIAKSLGATPRATGRFALPEAPWFLVYACKKNQRIEKVAPRFRRSRKIRHYFLKSKPDSLGKLYFLKAEEFKSFQSGDLKFEALTLHQ